MEKRKRDRQLNLFRNAGLLFWRQHHPCICLLTSSETQPNARLSRWPHFSNMQCEGMGCSSLQDPAVDASTAPFPAASTLLFLESLCLPPDSLPHNLGAVATCPSPRDDWVRVDPILPPDHRDWYREGLRSKLVYDFTRNPVTLGGTWRRWSCSEGRTAWPEKDKVPRKAELRERKGSQ